MKRFLFAFLIIFSVTLPAKSSWAEKGIGEGYAVINFKELIQTTVMLGGFDIYDKDIADEYGRLVYCSLYTENFDNDIEWNNIRKRITARVIEKKEYYRILYEMSSPFKLGRYDFEGQFFPFTDDTAIRNVGSMSLLSYNDYQGYCRTKKKNDFFVPVVRLLLNQPVTIDRFQISMDDVENVLARLAEAGNKERWVYGRIRFRVTDAVGAVWSNNKISREELRGEITSVDFFLDREMTKMIGSIQLSK